MADRTSAGLFGKIFELLAKNPTDEHKAMAKEIFPLTRNYDFSNYQMDADESLLTLGLAVRGTHPEYPNDGEFIAYADQECFEGMVVSGT